MSDVSDAALRAEFEPILRGEFIGLGRLRADPTLTHCTECAGQAR